MTAYLSTSLETIMTIITRIKQGLWIVLFMLSPLSLWAQTKTDIKPEISQEIRNLLTVLKQKYPATTFNQVAATPVAGIYQVIMGQNVAYIDASARYFMFGHLFDMQTQTDLTEPVLEATSKVKFDELVVRAKDQVLMYGNPSAKPSLIVFSDPNCGFCKRFERELKSLTDKKNNDANWAVWVVLYPVLGQDSMDKASAIWCASDREQAWRTWMLSSNHKEPAYQHCAHPIARNLALGKSLSITGTPSLVLPNGSVVSGYKTAAELESYLTDIANQAKLTASK